MAEMAKLAELTAARSPGQAVQYLAELLGLDPSDARAREIAQRFHLPLPEPTAGFGDLGELGDDDLEEYAVIATGTGLPRGTTPRPSRFEGPGGQWGDAEPAIEVASGDIDIDAGGATIGIDLESTTRLASASGWDPAASGTRLAEARHLGGDGDRGQRPAREPYEATRPRGRGVDELELPGGRTTAAQHETEASAAASISLGDDSTKPILRVAIEVGQPKSSKSCSRATLNPSVPAEKE